MKDLYCLLGLDIAATPQEIKKTYRMLAMKCHPDRGGNAELFQELNEAYHILSDPTRRQEYDIALAEYQLSLTLPDLSELDEDSITDEIIDSDIDDINANLDVTINVELSLLEAYSGKDFRANYTLPSGKLRSTDIFIPSGVFAGEILTIPGAGDDSEHDLSSGDLHVVINVIEDENYYRDGNDLVTKIYISPIESMIGASKLVKHIAGSTVTVEVSPGAVTGTCVIVPDLGFTSVDGDINGNFVCEIEIFSLPVYDCEIIEQLKALSTEISSIDQQ